jgi:hypothetical protein
MQRSLPVRQRGSGACPDTQRSNKPCATTISTHSVRPDSLSPPKLNPVEPPWYVTRMPGGVGGVASRGVPLSRSSARPRRWRSLWRRTGIVKGFRTPASHWREGMHGGRRPKSLEGGKTAGGVRTDAGIKRQILSTSYPLMRLRIEAPSLGFCCRILTRLKGASVRASRRQCTKSWKVVDV